MCASVRMNGYRVVRHDSRVHFIAPLPSSIHWLRILGGDVAALKTWLEQTLVQITSSSSCSADSESI